MIVLMTIIVRLFSLTRLILGMIAKMTSFIVWVTLVVVNIVCVIWNWRCRLVRV